MTLSVKWQYRMKLTCPRTGETEMTRERTNTTSRITLFTFKNKDVALISLALRTCLERKHHGLVVGRFFFGHRAWFGSTKSQDCNANQDTTESQHREWFSWRHIARRQCCSLLSQNLTVLEGISPSMLVTDEEYHRSTRNSRNNHRRVAFPKAFHLLSFEKSMPINLVLINESHLTCHLINEVAHKRVHYNLVIRDVVDVFQNRIWPMVWGQG